MSLEYIAPFGLWIKARTFGDPLFCGQIILCCVVDNAQISVDERSRARLDVSHAWNRQWNGQASNLAYPQGPKVTLGPLSI